MEACFFFPETPKEKASKLGFGYGAHQELAIALSIPTTGEFSTLPEVIDEIVKIGAVIDSQPE